MTLLLATACLRTVDTTEAATPTLAPPGFLSDEDVPAPPALDPEVVRSGEVLYQAHCAVCHRADLSGEPGWMIPKDDGTYKPPPHDSTGHTWHHSDQFFLEIVRDGSSDPIATMPTFRDQLIDREINSILEFLKSTWGPDERAIQWEVSWREEQASS